MSAARSSFLLAIGAAYGHLSNCSDAELAELEEWARASFDSYGAWCAAMVASEIKRRADNKREAAP